jgi:Na+:H+ antiporter, NhaC family
MNTSLRFSQSLWVLLTIFGILFPALFFGKAEPHMPLLIATIAAATLLRFFGIRWKQMEDGLIKGIQSAIAPMLILCLIGILIGVWMMSGTVPTILDLGITLISPKYFTISALFLTIIVSSVTGSSFTTLSTIGVALMGVSTALGLDPLLTAGAIICGACFGDKMSPLSDTTNFAAAMADVSLGTHVKYMMNTSIPALALAALFFGLQGQTVQVNLEAISQIRLALEQRFTLGVTTLFPALVVLICSVLRKPILPTLVFGIVSGIATAAVVQGAHSPVEWMNVMQKGFVSEIPNEAVKAIVDRGGLLSMTWSLALILIALSLGGLLQSSGVFQALFEGLIKRIKRDGELVGLAGSSSILVNLLTGEQYLSILLPGQMFREAFIARKMEGRRLSRTLEDCGTLVNPLIPWGVSGAFFTTTLHVSTLDYLPYVPYLWLSPILTFLFAWRRQRA